MVSGDIAFLFPGQGCQYPRMALDLYDSSQKVRDLFDLASNSSGIDLLELIREGDAERLKRSDLSQPALTLASLAAAAALNERGIQPCLCAGFSLGEYPALALSGVLDLKSVFRLVTVRGRAMQAAADRLRAKSGGTLASPNKTSLSSPGSDEPGMAALIGLQPETVESLITQWKDEGLDGLYAANYNSPSQTVVAGTAAALEAAESRFKAAGARRFIRLKVAGPFHTPLMAEAAETFAREAAACTFSDPSIPLFSNVTGALVSSGEEARKLARRQIMEAVRWTEEEASIANKRPDLVLEVGPGRVLQGLWKDSGSAIPCVGAGTVDEIAAL